MNNPGSEMHKDQKFFFDTNNFDEPEIIEEEIEEDLPPPPPSFSEDELEAAKVSAHLAGKQEGLAEAKASHEKYIADTLQKIQVHFATLFEAESLREEQYERESVDLCLATLEKLFPILLEEFGADDLKKSIDHVLQSQKSTSEIRIDVPEDAKDGICTHFESLQDIPVRYDVHADSTLTNGQCKLSWKDGGAVRDVPALSQNIMETLQSLLQETKTVVPDDQNHDIKEEDNADQESTHTDPVPDTTGDLHE